MHVYIKPMQKFLTCLVCGDNAFDYREVQMNTAGMTLMGWDGFNKSADGAICTRCGFVHTFMGTSHQILDADLVAPEDLPAVPPEAPRIPHE